MLFEGILLRFTDENKGRSPVRETISEVKRIATIIVVVIITVDNNINRTRVLLFRIGME
ncbi:MAG: hypothetical protein LE180_05550 [Endomicrobium sp.]|uniref:hypothetical protein n=1 Tax=Candidatus Endomicrobiellum pyrsonymphae TaxID=1408203 RepID=UPI0035755080|nr:hypothetical protein [Endomicrobium sp.]